MTGSGRKHIVVTGGAGFLGTNLCRWLLIKGHAVTCVDNFRTGGKETLLGLMELGTLDIIRQDITLPLLVEDVDEIYNLACSASPVHYQADPVHTLKTCVQGSLNLLEIARYSDAKIFQASTSEVYGDPETHPQHEGYRGSVNPVGPRACYDEGKRCAETLFLNYFRQHKVRVKVGRIFNTYGPYMRLNDGRVVPNLIGQALKNRPLTIYGDGNQTRSFCYVDDLIEAMQRLMATSDDVSGPFNLGNPAEITMLELADTIIDLTGSRSRITFRPLPVDDPVRRCPDISHAREKLGWTPSTSLSEGLKRTIDYFEDVLMTKGNTSSKAMTGS
ncbi:UDP-glucuronic acid decarboxylase family protein [Methylocaldum sp.]|uniref:UDP-glucuronic acid decarboxylase family protein n=1 Tax=Methylocaldum sp. TaxID=1969727 RepID=UPI002D4819F9|nr:UDP-glucuronic acid decarboxylase family protein [Methylocaldum sp.]HYE33872.1 UDP-glucuronic acid decarboxylase family protein [Methylocaldum sp.]